MGYPVAYRSGASGYGFQKLPAPWKPATGPANDNIPLVANDNRPVSPPPRGAPRRGYGRALAKLSRYTLGNPFIDPWRDALSLLPGAGTPLADPLTGRYRNYGNLALYRTWSNREVTQFYIDNTPNGDSLRNTGAPGDLSNPFDIGNISKLPTLVAGQYVYEGYTQFDGAFGWRGRECATYGPVPAGPGLKARSGWTNPNTMMVPVAPVALPYGLIPFKVPDLWPQGYTGGEPAQVQPLAPPRLPPRRPPGPRVKERKTKGTQRMMAVIKFLGDVTEGVEVMEAFYDALPSQYKLRMRNPRPDEKARQVYRHWDKVDLDTALFNAVFGQATDIVWARLGLKHPSGRYGGAMGANRALSQGFGEGVSRELEVIHDKIARIVNSVTGSTIKLASQR